MCKAGTIAVSALLLTLLFMPALASDEPPTQTEVREEIETRLIQLDVSVLGKGSRGYASMPGLTLDHFEIRLDGKLLTPEQRERVTIDALCDQVPSAAPADPSEPTPVVAAPTLRPIIAIIDFNYVDARGRHRIADTLDELAEHAKANSAVYKIYGFTRQVRQLSGDFTDDPEKIRRAAQLIRETFERGPRIPVGEEGIPQDNDEDTLAATLEDSPFSEVSSLGAAIEEIRFSDIWGDARSDYRPSASLSAIENIMRAHAHLSGRKAVLLFSSEAFRYSRENRRDMDVLGVQDLGRLGFTIWTIDVEGVGRRASGASELLSMLSQDSGGDTIRNTNNLMRAFEGAEEQLSCYYLLSLPVPASANKSSRHELAVRIDTNKYPDLWGTRVMAPTKLTLHDRATRSRNRRISALFSPEDYPSPEVTATIGYPEPRGDKSVLPVFVRVPLSDLTWIPQDGKHVAKVLLDAVVERDTGLGSHPICRTNTNDLGVLELTLPRPPAPSSSAGLTVIMPCLLDKDGLITARGVLTDIESNDSGAGRSSVLIRRKGLDEWTALETRIQASSGKDFVWNQQLKTARKDRKRMAWRAVSQTRPASVVDRIALRYVLCGPERQAASREVAHVLVHLPKDGEASVSGVIPASGLQIAQAEGEGSFCSSAMVVLPEYTMEPGDYGLVILRKGVDLAEAVRALESPDLEATEKILGAARFTVTP